MTEVSLPEFLEDVVARLQALAEQTPAQQPVPAATVAAYRQIIAQVADVGIDVAEFEIAAEMTTVDYDLFKTRLSWALDFITMLLARRPKRLSVTLPDDE